jgi:hypothetical protein
LQGGDHRVLIRGRELGELSLGGLRFHAMPGDGLC